MTLKYYNNIIKYLLQWLDIVLVNNVVSCERRCIKMAVVGIYIFYNIAIKLSSIWQDYKHLI